MSEANKRQVGGSHYKKMGIEHWDLVVANDLDYFQGQITKYVMRWKDKNGIQDLEKAKHFLEKYIESETAKREARLEPAKCCAHCVFHGTSQDGAIPALKVPPHMKWCPQYLCFTSDAEGSGCERYEATLR